jgi:hypothetical protein
MAITLPFLGVDNFACSPVAKVLYKNYGIVIFGQEMSSFPLA